MSRIVQKFGGTSLADPAARTMLAEKVRKARTAGDEIVLVVSAMGRNGDPYATDTLLALLNEFKGGADGLINDLMVSCGEVISACVIAALLNSKGVGAVPLTAYTAGISAEGPFGDASPTVVDASLIQTILDKGKVPVVAGFQGIDARGRVITLGRGGSDTSAVAIGAALAADFVDIYKDVPGVAKADPRLVKGVPFMKFLDYDSMFRLANHGARVLHDKSALLAKESGLKMRVRSTFDDDEGTLIGPKGSGEAVPAFLGLATTPEPGDKIRVTAVFAAGAGAGERGVALARETAMNMNSDVTQRPSDDPDAAVFSCSRDKAASVAATLFKALN